MRPHSILYIGSNVGTSLHRASALRRLGNDVFIIDPAALLPRVALLSAWSWKTGGMLLERFVQRRILASVRGRSFDLVYVDGGELVGPTLVSELRNRFGTVINYNIDDPYGGRDGRRWRLYLRAVPFYDLIVVVRNCNISEAKARGARRVLLVLRSADEVAHAPREIGPQDRLKWASDVSFVGTWMPERGPLLARLTEIDVPLSIFGNRWQKAREWPVLRKYWRGPGLREDDYGRAVLCAKVNLGLVSRGNRDLSTQRSLEIPYLGGVLCAERTAEHTELYNENEEAVFWSGPEECAEKCLDLLRNDEHRERLATNGRRRCLQNKTTNEAVVAQILQEVLLAGKAKTGTFENPSSSLPQHQVSAEYRI